jgi:hypothetical protein
VDLVLFERDHIAPVVAVVYPAFKVAERLVQQLGPVCFWQHFNDLKPHVLMLKPKLERVARVVACHHRTKRKKPGRWKHPGLAVNYNFETRSRISTQFDHFHFSKLEIHAAQGYLS